MAPRGNKRYGAIHGGVVQIVFGSVQELAGLVAAAGAAAETDDAILIHKLFDATSFLITVALGQRLFIDLRVARVGRVHTKEHEVPVVLEQVHVAPSSWGTVQIVWLQLL